MKIKSGFTLIELLAVIVILAIIALIATPTILGVIDNAKMGAAKSSALGYIDAVEKTIAINMLDSNKENIVDNVYQTTDLEQTKYALSVKGNKPEDSSWLKVEKGQVVSYSFKLGDYIVTYDGTNNEPTVEKGDAVADVLSSGPTYGVTKEAAQAIDTHKGIIYLDPTNLSNTCNASNSLSTTETKTGCMKWYIYDDSGDNYTMILDHNTTARIKWNDDNINVAYENSNLKSVVDDLVTTSGWVLEPRLILAEEVNTITGKTEFDSTNINSWYYLDTKTQTKGTFSSTTRSSYDWLYNNLNKCKTDSTDYGCTLEDNDTYTGYGTADDGNTWGYWTSTTVGCSSSDSFVWFMNRDGNLYRSVSDDTHRGVRPVITISKSIVS